MTVQQIHGVCPQALEALADQSVHCCVTSPPYWGLRDYGFAEQIGLEATPEEWCTRLVEVFDQVRRVLRDDGTLWVNIGDAYVANRKGHSGFESSTLTKQADVAKRGALDVHFSRARRGTDCDPKRGTAAHGQPMRREVSDLKTKDLIGQPWMLAFALRAAGWYLRSCIIWHKPNPMPESTTDRPTTSHEYIFLLSKSARYHYDGDAIAEPVSASSLARVTQPEYEDQAGSLRANAGGKTNGTMKAVLKKAGKNSRIHVTRQAGGAAPQKRMPPIGGVKAVGQNGNATYSGNQPEWSDTRNARSVWTIATEPSREEHFAAFPREIPRRAILAGCPAGGTVLDPFGGTGTTGVVAAMLGRNAILIEGSKKYIEIAQRRLHEKVGLYA